MENKKSTTCQEFEKQSSPAAGHPIPAMSGRCRMVAAGLLDVLAGGRKKWWLLPIVLVLGAVGTLALFAGTGAAPFIYTMF